ncbi:sigma-70 family RNA polymerase sigma factor [Aeromicrobium stalagmiti]|uniref:sigma-70 family RNA polymerase sigma factor n=1 Tax=Aeromicrobium stalagmiti TaxID=2738988 RepID=UPI0034649635
MAPWRSSRASDDGVPGTPDALAREGYARHGAELYGYALSRLADDAAAQDAVQETIVRAWRAGERFDPAAGSLRTWLYAILRNVIIDQANARQRATALAQTVVEEEDLMADQTGAVADVDLITRALGFISHDHRTAIVETYLRDRPYDEVAAELGVSVSTLRSRVFYGLKQLRHAMKMMVVEP